MDQACGVILDLLGFERLPGLCKLEDVVSGEIFGNAAGVGGGGEGDGATRGVLMNFGRMFAGDIKEEAWKLRLSEGGRDEGAAFGWYQLRVDAVARQVQAQRVGSEGGFLGAIGRGAI